MIRGECNCGAVAFEVSAEITDIYVCHCSICRKYTGSNGIPVVVIGNEAFRWLCGTDQVTHWKKPDADWESWFCRICGSSLPGINDPDHMFVPAGLIVEGGEGLKVAHHIWTGSRAGWDEIGDAGKQHTQEFTG